MEPNIEDLKVERLEILEDVLKIIEDWDKSYEMGIEIIEGVDLGLEEIKSINTPDFKAGRVVFEELIRAEILNREKIGDMRFGVEDVEAIELEIKDRTTTIINDNGNNVDIDLEMTELAANELYYNTLIRQVNAKLSSLSYVINS